MLVEKLCKRLRNTYDIYVMLQGPLLGHICTWAGLGLVTRCADCGNVLLRLVKARQRVLLDLRGMAYLSVNANAW